MFYVVNLLILLTYSYLTYHLRIKDRHYLIITGIHLSLIMGLRSQFVGSDTLNYYNIYSIITNSDNTFSGLKDLLGSHSVFTKAPVWTIMLKMVSIVSGEWKQTYVLFTGIFIITILCICIYLSKVPCRRATILYYLLFFTTSLNGTRTYMAICMVVLGYILLCNKHKFGILFFIVAIFIHNTSIIGIALILLSFLDISQKKMRRLMLFSIVVFLAGYQGIITLYVMFFPIYASTIDDTLNQVSASNIWIQIIYITCFIQALYIGRKKINIQEQNNTIGYRNLTIVILLEILMAVVGSNAWYIQRVLMYLQIFVIFLFPQLNNVKNRYRQIAVFIVYAGSFALFIYRIMHNLGGMVPYKFFWDC